MKKALFLTVSVALAGMAATANAHDYWFELEDWTPELDQPIVAHLHVGTKMVTELQREMEPDRMRSLLAVTPDGQTDLLADAQAGAKPMIDRQLNTDNGLLLVMNRKYAEIALEKEKFIDYLADEDATPDDFEQAIGNGKQRERYDRSVKALVGADPDPELAARVFGHELELTMVDLPGEGEDAGKPGVEFQLWQNKSPLVGHSIYVWKRDDDGELISHVKTTDKSGKAHFDLEQPGMWVARTWQLLPCRWCRSAKWSSHWASYSFSQ